MVFVCAEIGVNFRNLNEADEMIREAAAAGADAVKFQAYSMEEAARSPIKHLAKIQLGPMDIRYLYWRCRAAGVELMVTPMYPEAVPMLDPYVQRWKIRYKDRENREILDAIEKTGKPALISGKNVFCSPEYPPAKYPPSHSWVNYEGYSCHIPFIDHMSGTIRMYEDTLEYLEVHVKRDHYPDNYCPIDNAVSITMSELAELCRRLKP